MDASIANQPEQQTRFAAAGTLARSEEAEHPTGNRRRRLIIEFVVLFLVMPWLMRIAVYDFRVPMFYALPPVLIGFTAFLLFDPSFDLRRELQRGITRATLISILKIFLIGCVVVGCLVALVMPERLFALAAERPGTWLKIMTLYPFTSVLAQECVYRVFFFHRYGPLFKSRVTLIVVNAFVFGFGHVLFRNWIAVVGTFAVGLLFAWRYERTRSFWAVYFEHVLWGWLVFTIGLGVYFFTGVKNPAW
ncbi:CPBP family intramembrane glutamic endopeptidase [Hyphomicrobium methylovorum]|uniref:CPBP family intramembrane glutamic endopeptidase n=1 Tax=Hyphomicrobium methylovorum TaxID=84 RepID=UPI0015E77E43|nr:type II CAAX endopeptidase family protein [Hyphomicrobium methylovorum]